MLPKLSLLLVLVAAAFGLATPIAAQRQYCDCVTVWRDHVKKGYEEQRICGLARPGGPNLGNPRYYTRKRKWPYKGYKFCCSTLPRAFHVAVGLQPFCYKSNKKTECGGRTTKYGRCVNPDDVFCRLRGSVML